MDPVTLFTVSFALVFAGLALLKWRRASHLEARLQRLEGTLAMPPAAPREAKGSNAAAGNAPASVDEPTAGKPTVDEPTELVLEEDAVLDAEVRSTAYARAEAPSGPDPRRLEALALVNGAFETCCRLGFDAIVEKPATYRVTVPLTAANTRAVRYLADGMFPCLARVSVERDQAILHIDTSKGPP